MTEERSERFGFAAAPRCADPLPAADPRLLHGAWLRRALRVGASCAGAVPPAAQAAGAMSRRHCHDRGAVPARQGRSGPRRSLQCGGKILRRLFRRRFARPRPAHLARRHRPQAHDGGRSRHVFPAAGAAPRRGARSHRRGRAALSWAADQSQPSHHARRRLPGTRWPAARPMPSMRRCWSPTARSVIRV